MKRRHLFKIIAGSGCAASLGASAPDLVPQKLIINPDYVNAEYEEDIEFLPGYGVPAEYPRPRFNLNKETGEKEYVPFYKRINS